MKWLVARSLIPSNVGESTVVPAVLLNRVREGRAVLTLPRLPRAVSFSKPLNYLALICSVAGADTV